MLNLDTEIENGDGDTTELIETIADTRAINLEAWLDAKTLLLGCPQRLIHIANKSQLWSDTGRQGYGSLVEEAIAGPRSGD